MIALENLKSEMENITRILQAEMKLLETKMGKLQADMEILNMKVRKEARRRTGNGMVLNLHAAARLGEDDDI